MLDHSINSKLKQQNLFNQLFHYQFLRRFPNKLSFHHRISISLFIKLFFVKKVSSVLIIQKRKSNPFFFFFFGINFIRAFESFFISRVSLACQMTRFIEILDGSSLINFHLVLFSCFSPDDSLERAAENLLLSSPLKIHKFTTETKHTKTFFALS